jgi:Zn-dependent peptidase ImmA (M78 family)
MVWTARAMHDFLILRYAGRIKEGEICEDERICTVYHESTDLPDGAYVQANGRRIIFIRSTLSPIQKCFIFWHEIYHHLAAAHNINADHHAAEYEANCFAALACCPHISTDALIQAIADRYGVTYEIALLRLQQETTPFWHHHHHRGGGGGVNSTQLLPLCFTIGSLL